VLNQSYEPLSICSPKRAITLIFLYKAELIEKAQNKLIRTVSNSFAFPSVIKLCEYHSVPYHKVELSKKNIFHRDNNQCQYCGTKRGLLTLDHVIPKSRGGKTSWENLTTACFECNNKKGNRTPQEAKMTLRTKPHKPNYVLYLNKEVGTIKNEWKPFLFC
jgi:5-methylcytosine-specific restriction endonuclease McrA